MGLISGGLIIKRICASEIWGGAYFREGLLFFFFVFRGGVGGGLTIGILRYFKHALLQPKHFSLKYVILHTRTLFQSYFQRA